ncbi:hypothetical protein QYE76_027753 [Lolium multiflorum]|uniref:Uncharacterized protein n=1 Tax=Lolium multiflorum TaxID=4521 RepID=A0AAD8QJP4_LOLMU|nr:hypothetical protein QYE76_027753 [Lolium multiflorum]
MIETRRDMSAMPRRSQESRTTWTSTGTALSSNTWGLGMSRLPTIGNCPECRRKKKGATDVSVFKRLGPLPSRNKQTESSQEEDLEELEDDYEEEEDKYHRPRWCPDGLSRSQKRRVQRLRGVEEAERSTTAPSVPSASGSQIVRTVDVEDDADIEDQPPQDDEDELMFPELVDRCSKQAMEDQYMEDIAFGARFDDTDDEEKNENNDSLVLADYEGEDLPTIEWNRENPQLVEGTVFQTMMDCRNAITTYHILTKNNFEVVKSEPDKEE